MKRSVKLQVLASVGLFVAACCICAPKAHAQTWDGGGTDNNWSTDTNWDTNVEPVNDGTADIIFSGITRLTPNVDVNWSVNSVAFGVGATQSFAVGGNQLTIQGDGVTNNSTVLQTINTPVVLGTSQTWNAATGNLTFGGTVNNGGNLLTIAGANQTSINGAISGAGGLTKNDAGLLILGAANSFSGPVILNAGEIRANVAGSLANVDYTLNGGTLNLNNFAASMTSLSGAGAISMGTGALTVNQAGNTTYSGNMSSTGTGAIFTKQGAGTLTLSGNNNVMGGFVVSDGTLLADSADAFTDNVAYTVNGGTLDLNDLALTASSLSGTGGIVDLGTATLTVNQTTTTTYAGAIVGTGAGALVKSGTGTLILTGTNAYTGGTTVSAGTLQGDTDSLNGDISVASGATVVFDQATNDTYADDISGDGALTKTGAGVLTMTGTNNYTGTTTVSAGTLQMGTAMPNSLPANRAYVVNGGTLDLNNNDLSMLRLSGSGGTVALGNSAATELTVNTTTSDTYAGAITGAGGFTKQGTGTTILTGTNTYSGGTTVTAGTLQGTTSSLQGAITNNATVAFNQTTNGTYAGVMSGSGAVTKSGTGTLTFSNNNTYAGATSVNAGRLDVNGQIDSVTTVGASGTLGGTGVIQKAVNNQGIVSAGTSGSPFGTLEVNSYSTNGGTTQVNVDNSNNTSQLNVNNNANLNGGDVAVNAAAGTYNAGQKFTFMTTGTRTGQFDSITDNIAGLDAVLGYDGGEVFFTLLRNGKTYEAVGRTPNQRAVGAYLDRISPNATGDLQTVFNGINIISDSQARVAYDQLGGAVHGTLAQVGLQNTTLVINQITSRVRSMPYTAGSPCGGMVGSMAPDVMDLGAASSDSVSPVTLVNCGPDGCGEEVYGCNDYSGCGPTMCCRKTTWSPWAQGYGLGGAAKSDGNASGIEYSMGGVVGGIERWVDDRQLVGWWGGYIGSNVVNDGDQKINGGQFGAYIFTQYDNSYTTWLAGAEFDSYQTRRHLDFDGIDRFASADSDGWQGFAYWEHGLAVETCTEVFQPFVALQYVFLRQNSFQESGADSVNLNGDGTDTNSLRGMLGARLQHVLYNHNGRRTLPEVHAMWLHEFLDTNTVLNAQFAGAPGAGGFAVTGLDLGRDWAVLGCNFTWEMHDCWSMFVNYDCQTNSQQTFHVGSGGVGHVW